MSIHIQFDVFVLFRDPMVSSSSPHGAPGTTQECPWTDYMDSVEFKVRSTLRNQFKDCILHILLLQYISVLLEIPSVKHIPGPFTFTYVKLQCVGNESVISFQRKRFNE